MPLCVVWCIWLAPGVCLHHHEAVVGACSGGGDGGGKPVMRHTADVHHDYVTRTHVLAENGHKQH